MKMSASQDVTTSGITENQAYKVAVTGKMFSSVMDKLYSNKLGSTIREVCSNAYDSHTAAGTVVPFEVTLPSKEDQELTIKDYGTGLSNNRIFQLFGTLFESSKDQSNTSVGGFGLGSKSPFSIADTFTIESNWEGTKTHFLNFKDSFGIPQISITNTEETEEVNGIKVIIPIDYSQYSNVVQEIRKQLYCFETKPLINGEVKSDAWWMGFVDESEKKPESMPFSMNTRAEYMGTRICEFSLEEFVIQIGPVLYPLDLSRLSGEIKKKCEAFNCFRPESDVKKSNYTTRTIFITEFAIGELDISPSRESLSYIPDTVDKLNAYFVEFFDAEKKILHDFISSKKTAVEKIYWFMQCQKKQDQEMIKTIEITDKVFDANSLEDSTCLLSNLSQSLYNGTSLTAWVKPTIFQANVSCKVTDIDATGVKKLFNMVDSCECDPTKTTELPQLVVPGFPAKPIELGSYVNAITEVVRDVPVVRINQASDFLYRKKESMRLGVEDLYDVFFTSPENQQKTGFIYNDSPKKAKERLGFYVDTIKASAGDVYVFTPNHVGDNAPHVAIDAIIDHIATYTGIPKESVEGKFILMSSLPLRPVVVQSALEFIEATPKKEKVKTDKDELRGVYWDNRANGTAGVERNATKKDFADAKESEERRFGPSHVFKFLIVPIQDTFKATYKQMNSSYTKFCNRFDIAVAFISAKTTAENIDYLKSIGGKTPDEFISPLMQECEKGLTYRPILDFLNNLVQRGDLFDFEDTVSILFRAKKRNTSLKMPTIFEILYSELNGDATAFTKSERDYRTLFENADYFNKVIPTKYSDKRLMPIICSDTVDYKYRRGTGCVNTLDRTPVIGTLRMLRDRAIGIQDFKSMRRLLGKCTKPGKMFFEQKEYLSKEFQMFSLVRTSITDEQLDNVLELITNFKGENCEKNDMDKSKPESGCTDAADTL